MGSNDNIITIELAGEQHHLPLKNGDDPDSPSLRLAGDVQITNVCAGILAPRLAQLQWDILLPADRDAVPLAHMVSTFLGRRQYVVPVETGIQPSDVRLPQEDIRLVRGQRVLVLQSVACSRRPAERISGLLDELGAKLAGKAAVAVSEDVPGADDYLAVCRFDPTALQRS